MKIKKITPAEQKEIKEWFEKIDKIVEDKKNKNKNKKDGNSSSPVPWSGRNQ